MTRDKKPLVRCGECWHWRPLEKDRGECWPADCFDGYYKWPARVTVRGYQCEAGILVTHRTFGCVQGVRK